MTYYKECTVRFSTGREIPYENFSGKTEHQWRNYLTRELGYDLRSTDLFFSSEIIPDDTLISTPRKFGG